MNWVPIGFILYVCLEKKCNCCFLWGFLCFVEVALHLCRISDKSSKLLLLGLNKSWDNSAAVGGVESIVAF